MKKILIIISVFLAFSACSKLEDLNKNVKDFAQVSGESLYNGATRQFMIQLSTENVKPESFVDVDATFCQYYLSG